MKKNDNLSVNNATVEEPKKKSVLKKILKILGVIAVAILGGIGIYYFGKSSGLKEALTSDGLADMKDQAASEAIDEYRESIVHYAASGDFASAFTDNDGNRKYLLYKLTDEQPDWWSAGDTRHFDLAEEVLKF